MKTGVSTASLFNRKNNEDAMPYLAELGVRTAEVFLTSFSEYGKEFGSILAKRKGQVCVHSIHDLNTQFEPQLFATNERVKKDAYFWLEKVMEAGRELGAKYYTFHGTARIKRAARSGDKDDFNALCENFTEIFEFCGNYGLRLCLENVEWATYNRVGVFEKIRAQLPSIGGVLDIKQARISGFDYRDYLKEMGGNLTHVHVSDLDERGKIRLPGKGIFDFDELVSRLQDVGFDDALIIEVYKDDYSLPEELKIAVDYLDEILYKKGCLQK